MLILGIHATIVVTGLCRGSRDGLERKERVIDVKTPMRMSRSIEILTLAEWK